MGQTLTLTGLYNVLEALREGRVLTAKEKVIHDAGLVAVLKSLHDELDAAVLAAYGWAGITLPRDEQTLLARLVALNTQRVEEEANKKIAYLRPAYQNPTLRNNATAALTAASTAPMTTAQVAACIGGKADAKSQLPDILATLVALGRAQQVSDTRFAAV